MLEASPHPGAPAVTCQCLHTPAERNWVHLNTLPVHKAFTLPEGNCPQQKITLLSLARMQFPAESQLVMGGSHALCSLHCQRLFSHFFVLTSLCSFVG